MRFKGQYWTVECDDCQRVISDLDDNGFEDVHLCYGCSARRHQDFIITPCELCKKPMGDVHPFWNPNEQFAHEDCVRQLSEEEQERQEWTNEFY